MSAEIATFDKVRMAAATLRQAGSKVTASKVIELIGGGSKATVVAHLQTLRSQPQEQDDLPLAVVEMVRPALNEVYEAGRKAEADRLRAVSQRLSATLEEQDAQIAELVDDHRDLNAALSAASARAEQLLAENAALESRIAKLLAANTALNETLAVERSRGADDMKVVLGRIESAISRNSGPASRSQKHRRTLSLPADRPSRD